MVIIAVAINQCVEISNEQTDGIDAKNPATHAFNRKCNKINDIKQDLGTYISILFYFFSHTSYCRCVIYMNVKKVNGIKIL